MRARLVLLLGLAPLARASDCNKNKHCSDDEFCYSTTSGGACSNKNCACEACDGFGQPGFGSSDENCDRYESRCSYACDGSDYPATAPAPAAPSHDSEIAAWAALAPRGVREAWEKAGLDFGQQLREAFSGSSDAEELAEMSVAVASDVDEASRSERANVRARGVGGIHDENAQRWWGLERTTYLTRDLLDVLAQVDALDGRHGDSVLLADAMRRVAELVSTPPGDSEIEQRIDAAWTAIDAYGGSLPAAEEAADPHDQPGLWLAATLGRITDISRRVYDALTP